MYNPHIDEDKIAVVQEEVAPVVQTAQSMAVSTAQEYTDAAEFVRRVKAGQKRVKDLFKPMKEAAHAAHKAVTTRENEVLAPLIEANKIVGDQMKTWYDEQERRRLKEEARLRAAAEEQARKERERLEREAAKLKTPELREQRLEQAEQVVPSDVHVEDTVPKVKGQSVRKIWNAKIVDPKAAAEAIMQWPDWEAYIEIRESELGRFAARTKGNVKIPGVEIVARSSHF